MNESNFYEIDYSAIKQEIIQLPSDETRIILQFPDGLLGRTMHEIIFYISQINSKIDCVIAGDPSYGACDLPISQAEIMGIKTIFHFGHSTFAFPTPKEFSGRVIYFPIKVSIDIYWDEIINEIKNMGWKSIGFLTTIQHIDLYKTASTIFRQHNFHLIQHKEGQILGCNQDRATKIADDVDGFLVIAGGDFHASPIVVATGRPTLRFDPFNGSFKHFGIDFRNKYLSRRFAQIQKAKSAKSWGIIVSLKSGQIPHDNGTRLLKMMKKHGLQGNLFVMHRVDLAHLINFEKIEAWVITLCPRIATDDYINIMKPILTSREFSVVIGQLSWENFIEPKNDEHLLTIEDFI